jgi:F-type H+-transporting ATPase subunit gamma
LSDVEVADIQAVEASFLSYFLDKHENILSKIREEKQISKELGSMKAIKRRRLTVKNISQITKAMNLVATSKLQRARANKTAIGRPVQATFDIVYNTVKDENVLEQPFVKPREVKNTAYVLITSNRGLCGGYNSNVCKALAAHAKQTDANAVIIPVGTKGRDYFKRRNGNLIETPPPSETPNFSEAKAVADRLVNMYEAGEIDEVYLVYTQFFTVLALEPIVRKVLPLDPEYLRRNGKIWAFFPAPRQEIIPA